MAKKRDRIPSDKELLFQLKMKKTDNKTGAVVTIFNSIIKFACIVLCFYFGYLSIKELAGKTTDANIVLNFLGDIKIDKWIAYVFGFAGSAYGILQRNLRRSELDRLSNRNNELEKRINPSKQTSNLTPNGTTRKEDLAWKI